MALLKLYDEKSLLLTVKQDTIHLIHHAAEIEPVKKLVECHDILDLTLEISNKFPSIFPTLPQCDESALLHLRHLTRELTVYHRAVLPCPDLDLYIYKITRLLTLYQVPRQKT